MTPTLMLRRAGVWTPVTIEGAPPPEPPENVAPGTPSGLVISTLSTTSLGVSWTAAVDSDGTVVAYQVRVNGVLTATVSGTSTTLTGLLASTSYTIAVRAVDNDGALGTDVSGSGSTSAEPPATVTHGREITALNTGHTAYLDPVLGRTLTDADLTVHNSLVSVSDFVGNGGTITKRWFKGGLIIDRTGVTIRASKFDGGVSGYYAGVHRPFSLDWCTIDTPGAAGDDGIHYQDYTANRCKIGGHSDGAKTNGNAVLTECYIRVEGQDAEDHNDGTQNVGGNGAVTVARCNIDIRPTNGTGAPNAALFCADGATGLQTWTDNWLAGGGYVMRLYDNGTYNVQGNEVLNNSWVFGPAHRAVIPPTSVTWGTVRLNVLVNASGTVLSTLAAP